MATPNMPTLRLHDVDYNTKRITRSYVLSTVNTGGRSQSARLDRVPVRKTDLSVPMKETPNSQFQHDHLALYTTYYRGLVTYLATLFLPTGYPQSVTEDYTPYQIYDSLQAFASSIAGLLSSRAVLQSLNVVSSSLDSKSDSLPANSTSAATAATLLSIAQSTLANLTTILFASHAAPRISVDVKFYRFLADVVNDAAFVLDLCAPSLPDRWSKLFTLLPVGLSLNLGLLRQLSIFETFSMFTPSPRVLVLCSSSMLRAVCGVAGGSSKAVLSNHFARNNPDQVGDLNAKDGSQETVVGLVGLWIGGILVSKVESLVATWCWMAALLTIHLWTNWMAVKSVRLSFLNRERAALVSQEVVNIMRRKGEWHELPSSVRIGEMESVLGIRRMVKQWWRSMRGLEHSHGANWRYWRIGVCTEEFVATIIGGAKADTGTMLSLLETFAGEQYILWIDSDHSSTTVVLKRNADPRDQLKAFVNAHIVHNEKYEASEVVPTLESTLRELGSCWNDICHSLERAGWDLSMTNLGNGQGVRFDVEVR